tara:strand:- start:1122 stop:1484 length:363 start_codon:yes stop_codon:yes gene_type:complete
MPKKSSNKKIITLLVILIIIVVIVFIVNKNKGLTVNKLCSAYIKFADRARQNETHKSFEDYIYLKDNNKRMKECEKSMRHVHSINGRIKDEPEEKQERLEKMYKCMNSNNFEEYINCFRK